MPDPRYSYGYPDSLQEKARVLSTAEYLSAKMQEYGILPHSRTYYCLLFSLYHMFIIFVISY